jgi:deaminated glutathione amidase
MHFIIGILMSTLDPVTGELVHRIAALQMTSGPHVSANLAEAEALIAIAAGAGAKLAVLPEYFAMLGLRDTDKIAISEREGDGPIQDFLARMARRHGIWLVGGSVPMACEVPGKVFNSSLVFNADGQLVARYDKIHLFGFQSGNERYQEANTIVAGRDVVVVDSPIGRIGLSICYDLRFPELYRQMQAVDLILVPAAFTATTGRAHWEPLLRARAIENLAYVLAAGQAGHHANGRETHGDSMIIDPWGMLLDRLPSGTGVVLADMRPTQQSQWRQNLPALNHRVL